MRGRRGDGAGRPCIVEALRFACGVDAELKLVYVSYVKLRVLSGSSDLRGS
jgi:hypothetical protein